MSVSLPYLPSNKNVEALFAKIQSAKIPDKFSREFLQTTIGLKGSNDRPLIPLLRTLGFLDQAGAPTPAYRLLKNSDSAREAIAAAIRRSFAPLFEANEDVHKLSSDKLKGLIAQVAGTDDDMTARIASTFNSLTKLGDFAASDEPPPDDDEEDVQDEAIEPDRAGKANAGTGQSGLKPLQPSFHYNIQVHLPSNGTEDVYLNIFNALRKAFQ
jgi:hypothetical protein